MATNLSDELRQAIDAAQGAPIELIDAQRKERYLLVRADLYERLMARLDLDEPSDAEKKALMQEWGRRAGWEELDSNVFDDLEPR